MEKEVRKKKRDTINEFTSVIDQIYSKAKDLSVAINGAEVPLQSVLDNIDDYAVHYYYKQEGNYYSFVMQIGEGKSQLIDVLIEAATTTLKVLGVKFIGEKAV